MGYGVSPNLLYPASCFVTDGFLKLFGYTAVLVGVGIHSFKRFSLYFIMPAFWSGFIVLSGTCTKLTQDYCLLYRWILVANKPKLLKFVNHAAGAVFIQLLILLTGIGLGIGSWWTFFPYNQIPNYLAKWADEVPPLPAFSTNSVMLCVDVYYNPATIVFAETVAIAFAISEVLSILFAVGTFKALRNNSTKFSRKTYRMHVQFTALLVAQFVAPFVFMIGPVLWNLYRGYIDYVGKPPVQKPFGDFLITMITLYGAVNTILSLVFIAPFRRHIGRKVHNIWQFFVYVSQFQNPPPAAAGRMTRLSTVSSTMKVSLNNVRRPSSRIQETNF